MTAMMHTESIPILTKKDEHFAVRLFTSSSHSSNNHLPSFFLVEVDDVVLELPKKKCGFLSTPSGIPIIKR
jgi:hypothetical protein